MINQSEAVINLQGLTKRYGKTTAVDNLNLSIPRLGRRLGYWVPTGRGRAPQSRC